MTNTQKLRVVLEIDDKGARVLKGTDQDLRKVEKSAKDASKGISGFSDAMLGLNQGIELVQKLAQGLGQVYAFGRSGAALDRTRRSFDLLAQQFNTTGRALDAQLRPRLQGLVSDMQGIELAGQIMSLGLVSNQEDLVRLSGVAAQLGMDMNQLTLTLTNQTTRRFDTLGVKVAGFQDKVNKYVQDGLSQQAAFTKAFIDQSEEQIKIVGSVADTELGHYQKLEAAWADYSNKIKADAAGALDPIIQKLTELGGTKQNELNVGARILRRDRQQSAPGACYPG